MNTFKFSARSRLRLYGVHPDLILVISRGLLYSPYDFAITEGLRDIQRQKLLFDLGKSRTMMSRHLQQPDGYGHAIDIMATGDLDRDGDTDAKDKMRTWDQKIYRGIADGVIRASLELGIQITWGGQWTSLVDSVHFEIA